MNDISERSDTQENSPLEKAGTALFDAAFAERISRLKLAITKKSTLGYQGRRRSSLKGSSAEFSDFREYVPGDDVRRIDWNVYARLDRPYVREYMEERESAVNIFMDMSSSMSMEGKDLYSKRLAATMTMISLSNLDRVGLFMIYDDRVDNVRLAGGKNNIRRALDVIENAGYGRDADLFAAINRIPYIPAGLSIIISDFCRQSFIENGKNLCRYLSYRGQKTILLQVLSPFELRPDLTGSHMLIDSEEAYKPVRITMDSRVLRDYDREMSSFLHDTAGIAKETGAVYHLCDTSVPYDRMIFEELRDIYDV